LASAGARVGRADRGPASRPEGRRAQSTDRPMTRQRFLALAIGVVAASSCLQWFGCKPATPIPNAAVPDSFNVAFETSRGRFDVMARKRWAPIGVGRFYELVRSGYYDDS